MRFVGFNLFRVLYLVGIVGGLWLSMRVGGRLGTSGAIIGAMVGTILGLSAAGILDSLAYRSMIREIQSSSDEQLWKIVDEPHWNFRQTLALLQLSAREHDVGGKLARVIGMLESDQPSVRLFGWDALRLVYTDLANNIPKYEPRDSVEACRQHAAELRAKLSID